MSQPGQRDPHGSGRMVGRFEMFGSIASGGFAAVHLGRTTGSGGFSKLVAIKRLHRQFVADADITRMFLDEARVVARINHPNVVPILDFIEQDGELFMVMDYVEGVTLSHLWQLVGQKDESIPLDITLRIMVGTLHGLHAAHEARDERGNPLCVIHRDVSPDNILVGTDGNARILDFGVARAMGRFQATRQGVVKSKLSYMTPEQVMGEQLTRRADVFSASVVMWECLTGRRLFEGEHMGDFARKVTQQPITPPSTFNRTLPRKYDDIVMKGLERDPSMRWETTERMADAIETVGKPASTGRVGKWVKAIAADRLARRSDEVASIEVTPVEGSDVRNQQEELAAARASEGEDSFKAVATQVLRVRSRKRPVSEDGTEIIEVVSSPAKVDTPKTAIAAPRSAEAVAASSHPKFSPVRAQKPTPTPIPPARTPTPLPPPPAPRPTDTPATTTSQPFVMPKADAARVIEIDEPHPPLDAVSSVNPAAVSSPRQRKLLAGLGVGIGVLLVAGLYVLEWRNSPMASDSEPPAAAVPDPKPAEAPAPEPEPAPNPEAANPEAPSPETGASNEEPPAASATTSVVAAAKPVPRPAPARVSPRPRTRPTPAPPPPPPPKPDSLFERE
jgi:eukaryotic-like serine/threonine-protein kinase